MRRRKNGQSRLNRAGFFETRYAAAWTATRTRGEWRSDASNGVPSGFNSRPRS